MKVAAQRMVYPVFRSRRPPRTAFLRIRHALLVLHCSFFIIHSSFSQTSRGVFLTDTIELGQPFQYALSLRHPAGAEVFFPDTARHFAPFLVRDMTVFSTVTDAAGSLDSAVYTLVSFETRPLQLLQVPILLLSAEGDSTLLLSPADTVRLRERVRPTTRPDTLQLAADTRPLTLKPQMNYPLLVTILVGLLVVVGLVNLFFGRSIREQTELFQIYRLHRDFRRAFDRLLRDLNPSTAAEKAERAVVLWRAHLELLERKPYSTMTSREITDSIPDQRLSEALKETDGVIYGGVYSSQTQASLRVLYEVADSAYRRYRMRLIEARRRGRRQPAEEALLS